MTLKAACLGNAGVIGARQKKMVERNFFAGCERWIWHQDYALKRIRLELARSQSRGVIFASDKHRTVARAWLSFQGKMMRLDNGTRI
jgi:hypothetical protein